MSNTQNGLRFYGVVDAETVSADVLHELAVRTVAFRELAAVVAPAPYVRTEPGDAELEEFVRVVDALAANGPVLPAPVGAVFRDERVLAHWLEIHYAKLHEGLATVERRSDKSAPYDYVRMELGA